MQKIKNVLLVLTCLLASGICKAQFSSGSGTAADPWIIKTAQQLDNLRNYLGEDHRDKHFKLGSDIDLSAYIAQTYSAEGWLPIGQSGSSFCCQIDGDNHSVTGLWINRPNMNQVGLFGYVEKLENISVATDVAKGGVAGGGTVGALAGFCTTILNCHAAGFAAAKSGVNGNIGGLAGYVATVKNSSSACNVLAASTADNGGGLAGRVGTAINCHATGDVTATSIGGVHGGLAANGTVISNCYATGSVTATAESSRFGTVAGGLVGSCDSIKQSYATGAVTTSSRAGGLAGKANFVINCYATGDVTTYGIDGAGGISGGLLGEQRNIVKTCYATGNVIGYIAGGIIGETTSSYGQYNYCLQRTGLATTGTPPQFAVVYNLLTADQMVQAASFDGFDFDNIWAIDEGSTSPYLRNVGDNRPVPASNEPVASISDGTIWATSGNLHVRASQPTTLAVYSIVGAQLYRQSISAGETSIALPQGIYIAKLGNQTQKVVVR
jgi:hypothetical protein